MGLKRAFEKALKIVFYTFKEAVVTGVYKQPIDDDGFSDVEYSETLFKGICTSFVQNDLSVLSFGDRIQPTDVKCLIPGSYVSSLLLTTQDIVTVVSDYKGNEINKTYSVVAYDVDPYKVMYILLLRNA